jgi:hypothetical protein
MFSPSHFRASLFIALSLVLISAQRPPLVHARPDPNPCCGPISDAGSRLAEALDGMHVESLWLAHVHVNWETGEPDRGAGFEGEDTHTHCSAFAAAAAKRLGIYLLRPPEHGQQLLANAQAEWLAGTAGRQASWRRVSDMRKAQQLANVGNLVLAVYQNPDKRIPGHIAIVRPSEESPQELENNGPELIQAGQHNHDKISTRIAFENHPGAWPDGVQFYVHTLH